jgi:hypothetical protein
MGDIRLFVSHAHRDKAIAVALVDVVEAALVPDARILCTSHDDPRYREPEEGDVSEDLRLHLTQSGCVLAVLTPNSLRSPWCLFELGGAWVRTTHVYPLLAGGLSRADLPAALQGREAARLTRPAEIRRVLAGVSRDLQWPARPAGAADEALDRLVGIVRRTVWPAPPPRSGGPPPRRRGGTGRGARHGRPAAGALLGAIVGAALYLGMRPASRVR